MLIAQSYVQHFRRILYLGNIDCEISREILRFTNSFNISNFKCWLTIAGYGCWHINDYLYVGLLMPNLYVYAGQSFFSELLSKHALYSHLKSKHSKDFKSENSGRKRIFKISILKLLWKFRKKFEIFGESANIERSIPGEVLTRKSILKFQILQF